MILELFFSERNHICSVCVTNGHCDLQAMVGKNDQVDLISIRLTGKGKNGHVAERVNAEAIGFTAYSADELARRTAAYKDPPYKARRGTLYKYIKNVKSASEGCVTDE